MPTYVQNYIYLRLRLRKFKFGLKVGKDELEKFVQANTQELGKEKWLCPPLQKFKGADFVRKQARGQGSRCQGGCGILKQLL